MWAGNFLTQGVGGKFNVPLAKEAGHFQIFGFAQSGFFLTMQAGNGAAKIPNGNAD